MSVYLMAVATGSSESNRTANLKKAYYVADAGLLDAYERIAQAGGNFVHPLRLVHLISHQSTTDNGGYLCDRQQCR